MKRTRPLGETTAAMLADLVESIASRVVAAELADSVAARALAKSACDALCKAWMGSTHFYFPRGRHIDTRDRAMRLLDQFTGDNQLELARDFGTTEINVYRIIKQYRREHARARHTDLFAGTPHAPSPDEKPQGVETLEQFTAVVLTTLAKGGIDPAAAEAIALAVRDHMRKLWGGVQIHISKAYVVPGAARPGYHGDLFDSLG
jgi:Mor family transcriptional regulator